MVANFGYGAGISDTGYDIRNVYTYAAGIDLAGGTWQAIGLPTSAGITTVADMSDMEPALKTLSESPLRGVFYWEIFGCPLVGVADTPPDRVRTFFCVDAPAPRCKIGWIRVPGGGVLEIFEFQPQRPPGPVPWNGVGLTHISFNVRNLEKWHDYLKGKGVEIVSKPERSPRGHSFFFVRDFDGNLIELMDLGYMYHVLNWLGPLGGWLFRRGMYRKYYESKI